MKKAIISYYGDKPADSKDFARIINKKRFDTLNSYLSKGTILHGGDTDAANLYIGPTLMENAAIDEEIFGPILPIMTYEHLGDAIQYIKQHPTPLSLYVFTKRSSTEKTLIEQLSFGGACVNNTLGHYTNVELPFGGVGYSGMGQYHGKYNFLTFTHAKAVMKTATWLDVKLKYPPYRGLKFLKRFMK